MNCSINHVATSECINELQYTAQVSADYIFVEPPEGVCENNWSNKYFVNLVSSLQDEYKSMANVFNTITATMIDKQTLLVLTHGAKSLGQFLDLDVVKQLHLVTVFAFCLKPSRLANVSSNKPTVCLFLLFTFILLTFLCRRLCGTSMSYLRQAGCNTTRQKM